MEKRGKSLDKLRTVLDLLVNEIPLPAQYFNHKLTGNYKGRSECHVQPDWLLIYKIDGENLYLERTGTHSDLFKK